MICWVANSLTLGVWNGRKWCWSGCSSLWGEENDRTSCKFLLPLPEARDAGTPVPLFWGRLLLGWLPELRDSGPFIGSETFGAANRILHTQPSQTHSSFSEKLNRNNGNYFILIYFGLWSINSLPASLSAGVFEFHESFPLLQKPCFLLHPLDLALPFLRCSLVSPPFLQELLCGGSTVISALGPDGVKCFLLLFFPSSPLPSSPPPPILPRG